MRFLRLSPGLDGVEEFCVCVYVCGWVGMAPKSSAKKEKAAAKKALKTQYEEIAKHFQQEQLLAESLEVARKELEAKLAYEAEQAWLKAEEERLADETESMKPMFKKHHDSLSKIEAEALVKNEWELFMDTSGLPQAAKEATVNNYLEAGAQTLDPDYTAVLKSLVDIYKSAGEAEALALQEDQKGDAIEAAKYRSFMQKLEKLGIDKMDRTTNYLLQKSYSVYRDTEQNVVTGRIGDWKLAIWINHVKNPRFRLLELPELDIYINLPKSFALAHAAIRILHQPVNPLYKSKNAYMPLGGVFVIDVLGIPAESKVVLNWTLENSSTEIQYLGYPIPAVGQSAPTAQQLLNMLPFEINIFLPSFIIHWNPNPEIGWWDTITETWQTEGVSEVLYSHETFKVQFQTTKAKPHAVIQSRVREYPYKTWNCRPTSEKTALFTLVTAMLVVVFEVGEGWCQLVQVQPSTPVVADLLTQQFPPKVLLQQLSRRGLQLMPEDDDAQYCGVKVKNANLEVMSCRDAALAIPAFTLASSPLNKIKDADHILVRIQEIPEFLYPPTLEKSKLVKTVNYLRKGCVLIDHSDRLPDYIEQVDAVLADQHATYNAAMLVALRGKCLSTSQEKMEDGNVAFTNSVNALMYALRLFSFGP